MSRTSKDRPSRIKDRSVPRIPDHVGCQHSLAGGMWLWETRFVEHEAEWHTEEFYHVLDRWVPLQHLVDRELEQGYTPRQAWRRAQDRASLYPSQERRVFGPWAEKVSERVFVTRECDLPADPDAKPDKLHRSGAYCSWEVDRNSSVRRARRDRGCPCCGEDWGELHASRSRTRDVLRAAVQDHNTNGYAEVTLW